MERILKVFLGLAEFVCFWRCLTVRHNPGIRRKTNPDGASMTRSKACSSIGECLGFDGTILDRTLVDVSMYRCTFYGQQDSRVRPD